MQMTRDYKCGLLCLCCCSSVIHWQSQSLYKCHKRSCQALYEDKLEIWTGVLATETTIFPPSTDCDITDRGVV